MKNWGNCNLSLLVLILWLIPALLTPSAPLAEAQGPDWSWLSPDLDGDGLPNDVETTGWCNAVGCFQTDPLDADSDDDGLTDGQEKLFDSDPASDASPGIYVIYEDSFKTKEYYPWLQYGNKLIARDDKGSEADAIVVRRGTTFYVGGPLGATLKIAKSKSSLTYLSRVQDPYSGAWRVRVPSNGTVGKYTLKLGDKSLDLFVIFQLPTPSSGLTQLGIEKFLYDDDPTKDYDEMSILLGDNQYNYSYGFVAEGSSYRFRNLEDYVIKAINGKTSQKAAANALTDKVDAETVFRNPRVLYDSWRVLHPGSNPRQQCSQIAALLTAFNRAAGIPARPVMVDWRSGSFDHATEIWLYGTWRVYRGYKTYEMGSYPDNTHMGCEEPQWPRCGSYKYYSRYNWGKSRYRPWHSGGTGSGNVMVLADENWTSRGLAYRWPSWDVDVIKLNAHKLMTQNAKYWRYWGWTREPKNLGPPGWPPRPRGTSTSEVSTSSTGGTGLDFQSSAVQLGEIVAEYSVDSNGNGQYDQLVLEVEVTTTQPGSYWLLGQLSADHPEPMLMGTGGLVAQALTPINLVEGTQVVQLIFGGTEISLKRVDGPYLLSGLWITDVEDPSPTEFMNESLAYRGYGYTTAPYQAVDFETYGAMLSGSYSHHDLDSDGNGRSDALVVTTGINVYQPGSYTVEGSLYDSRDEWVGHATWTGTGPEVTLQFEDVAGTFGPYTLRDLDLLNPEGESIDYIAEAYTIEPISALVSPDLASLDILPVSDGVVALGETITPTHVFTESLVSGNLQIQAEVEVSEAGSYKLEAWLTDADGNLLTWAVGQPTDLPVGTQVLSLTFAGSAIRARGADGPYTVVALKVLNGDADYDVLDKVDVALTTQAYTLDQFVSTDTIVVFEDFMENGDSQWTADPSWTISQGVYFSPSNAWYGTDANASLALASTIDFSGMANAAIRFQTSHKLSAGGDTGYVEASTDGINWDTLATFSDDVSWSTHVLHLSDYDGESTVYLRFRLASAGGASDDGWYIDDVLVAGMIDSDGDGMPDGWEVKNGFNPLAGTDARADPDNDGLTNLQEYQNDTDPRDADSDDDGLSDGDEVNTHSTDPNNRDSDGDGLSDGDEVNTHSTDPNNRDSDGDGLSDGDEVNTHSTDPNNADSDRDGMPDGWEVDKGFNPLDDTDANADPDNDGLTNLEEYQKYTDPHNPDTDGDGLLDGKDPYPSRRIFMPVIFK
jgi:hypothetical protein